MNARVAVAYSGGRDSTALLHATLGACAEQGVEVVALHVHHVVLLVAPRQSPGCVLSCERNNLEPRPARLIARRKVRLFDGRGNPLNEGEGHVFTCGQPNDCVSAAKPGPVRKRFIASAFSHK